ncbi:mechanosensitive ion channel family protein [Candidatus Accumulibacter sp. ACC003]|uniref:mechanosensitive ion channel family protein n=1 Tax=Candidatus Accumulibacter sp. ACC003 TaxID=2823334 RepID=UPI0025C378AD|nr:mechanosensitive ion channel family protein [Candidatus Accumulibacter sp. ACC003]
MDWLEKMLERLAQGDTTTILALEVFLVVLGVVVANFILRRVLAKLEARTRLTATPWDNALVSALRQPLTVLAWLLGLCFAARIVEAGTEATIFEIIDPLRTIGVIACIAWFLVRFVGNVQDSIIDQRLARGESIDRTTVDAIGKLLHVSVLITAVLVGLQSLGFSISGVLAFGGIGGVAVGFAAKDLLANFFGGLMVYLDRPFEVGDWIRSPDKEIEGTVEEIGWRLTRIRTFDKRPLYIPNGIFTQIALENPSRMSNRRIKEMVGVRYDDIGKVAAIAADIKAMLRAHREIDQQQTMIVNFDQFSASSLDILVYTFTRTTVWVEYHEIKQDVLLKVAEIVARNGAEIAFPTRTLHVASGAGVMPLEREQKIAR